TRPSSRPSRLPANSLSCRELLADGPAAVPLPLVFSESQITLVGLEDAVKQFVVTLMTMFAAAALSAQQPDDSSIPQQLHDTGSFERVLVSPYEPLQLADLVGQADLIVEASTPGGRSFLTPSGRDIYTDYAFQVHNV